MFVRKPKTTGGYYGYHLLPVRVLRYYGYELFFYNIMLPLLYIGSSSMNDDEYNTRSLIILEQEGGVWVLEERFYLLFFLFFLLFKKHT